MAIGGGGEPRTGVDFFVFFSIFRPAGMVGSLTLCKVFRRFYILGGYGCLRGVDHPVCFISLKPNSTRLVALGSLRTLRRTSVVCYPSAIQRPSGVLSHTTALLRGLNVGKSVRLFSLPVDGSEAGTVGICQRLFRRVELRRGTKGQLTMTMRNSTKVCTSIRCMLSLLRRGKVPMRRLSNVPSFVTTRTTTGLRLVDRGRELIVVPNGVASSRLSVCLDRRRIPIVVGLSRYTSVMRSCVRSRPRCDCRCFRGVSATRRCRSSRRTRLGEEMFPCFSLVVVFGRRAQGSSDTG